ncbi:3131_t:CDS:2 [Ambispora gerdemannii]|uniref:3131_t:CDS:1 n=1 Tax=Ambispora gerdemannii TaxID=144530 RepID=A0A9N8V450_9GLOM|nr:3131_t:CDS:2 [Ambispora gerdemannii]
MPGNSHFNTLSSILAANLPLSKNLAYAHKGMFTFPTSALIENSQACLFTRSFSSTLAMRQQYFDTNKFVQKLESEGFTHEQSEAFMYSLTEVMNESMETITKNLVTKAEQEKSVYTSKVDFAQLKSEMQMVGKNDASLMKSENERLLAEIEKLKAKLNEEVRRTQAGVRLDLNLEKGRIRDEASSLELKIKETETRIESEISNLRTQMETTKFQMLQYMLGTLTGAGALILAYLRMFR